MRTIRHPAFLISVLLAAFFFKGVFLATLFPIFTGQDEARHYNIIQHVNEIAVPEDQRIPRGHAKNKESFSDYNFSEEILRTGQASGIDAFRSGIYNTTDFSDGYNGKNERTITERTWRPVNFYNPPDVGGGPSLYHTLAAKIESALSDQNILVRFYVIRIFSVLLGMLAVLFAFLIARTIGFDAFVSTLMAALVAFQPKFSMYTTNINYDTLLIPLFFLFTLGGVMSLRDGLNWKNISIMIFSLTLSVLTKGTGIILFVSFLGIIGFHLFKKAKNPKKLFVSAVLFIGVFLLSNALFETKYSLREFIPFKGSVGTTFASLGNYLEKSLTPGRLALSSRTYWGALGWNNDIITSHFTDMLWVVQEIAAIGIILFLFTTKKPDFLPEKQHMLFLLAMILALQLGIRLADWNVFASTGALDLGTPGRYFLPNLASHIILVFIGLGMLLGTRERFRNVLLGGVILMCFFSIFLTFDVILPRFYL